MKKIPVNLLKPGLLFSEPVYIEGNNIFVPAGIPIRQRDLDKLAAWGVETVQTNGLPGLFNEEEFSIRSKTKKTEQDLAPPENNNSTDEKTAAQASAPENKNGESSGEKTKQKPNSALSLSDVLDNSGTYQNYNSLIKQLDTIFYKIQIKEAITDNSSVSNISSQLMQAVRTEKARYAGYILGGEIKGQELAKSSINTAILSFLIAQELKYPHHKLLNIVIGSLLHDTGMLRLPKEIREKRGGLSEAERRLINSHPVLSCKIATKEFKYSDEIGAIILEHHERWDGEGYPNRAANENIDPGARIVSIADAFEAMVCPKPYRNSMLGNQAIKNLLADNSRRFDPEILKIFITIMGVYPIGSIVCLNNGVVARIMEVRPETPLRPKIQVLIDEYKSIYKNEEGFFIDLLMEKNLFIAKSMDIKDL